MTAASPLNRAKDLFERGDFLPVLALVIAIQGTVLISQSAAALFLAPAAIGQIRLFESAVSVAVLVAGFGAPALAIRDIAAHREGAVRSELLRDLLLLPILGAAALGLLGGIITLFEFDWAAQVANVLIASLALLVAVNLVRLASAIGQGLLIVRHIYLWAVAGSLMAATSQIFGASVGSIGSWIGGRLLGEALLLACILFAMQGNLPALSWRTAPRIPALLKTMGRATLVNAGLTLRMISDAAPILLLGGVLPGIVKEASGADVGHFGVATLFLSAALLAPAVVSQRTLPLIAAASESMRPVIFHQFLLRMIAVGLVVAAVLTTIAVSLRFFDDGRLDRGLVAAIWIMLSVPVKSIATAFGTMMLAMGELRLPIWITLLELTVVVLVFSCVGGTDAVWTATSSVIIGAVMSLIGMVFGNYYMNNRNRF